MVRIGVIATNVGEPQGEEETGRCLIMVKKQLKCPRCGKVLMRMYSRAVLSATCSCGCYINLKKDNKEKETKKK